MKIETIWQSLENEKTSESGLVYKRYSGLIEPDVYIALTYPENLRTIAVHVSTKIDFNLATWDKFRDLRISFRLDERNRDKQYLLISLLNNQHRDVFSILCEDLIQQVGNLEDETGLVKQLLIRLEKWRLLFEKMGQKGLSTEAQRGLFGELVFLNRFIEESHKHEYCVNSWKGTAKAVQDFQYSEWAIEIKTTHGKNQQKLHISSERQLDTTLVPNIYLIHFSLEVREGFGKTLNQLIGESIEVLKNAPAALNSFKLKLLEFGYFDHHKEFYSSTGYNIRQTICYKITDDFPRIIESMIPAGVGDVKYSLIISANDKWLVNLKDLISKIS
ncbi:MAG: PD-(D/E)XK motif protein [Balneolales bacterium]|nr:PD-(D/E)XK motif protein [Balneolales bacterium]